MHKNIIIFILLIFYNLKDTSSNNVSFTSSSFKMPSSPYSHIPQLPPIDDLEELEPDTYNLCPYCDEILPDILPEKIQNQLHNLQNKPITEEERQLFCIIHRAELNIVPLGL